MTEWITLPTPADLIIRVSLVVITLILDLTFGKITQKILPDIALKIGQIGQGFKKRLDKVSRSETERFYRGIVISVLVSFPAFSLGLVANSLIFTNALTAAVIIPLLLMLLAQRKNWEHLQTTFAHSNTSEKSELLKRNILIFSHNIVPYSVLFTLGGFSLLLPAIFVAGLLFTTNIIGANKPQSPYMAGVAILHQIIFILPALMASIILAIAMVFVPSSQLKAGAVLFNPATKGLPSTYFPLNIIATGVEINFRIQGSKSVEWIGPKDGRARMQTMHVKRAMLCLLAANFIYLFMGILILFYLASLLV